MMQQFAPPLCYNKLLFSGQISEKLWNDKNGPLREDTSGTLGV